MTEIENKDISTASGGTYGGFETKNAMPGYVPASTPNADVSNHQQLPEGFAATAPTPAPAPEEDAGSEEPESPEEDSGSDGAKDESSTPAKTTARKTASKPAAKS